MSLSPKTRETLSFAAAGILAAALGASAVIAQSSCAATPTQRAQAAKAETDLCRLRALATSLEALRPDLKPPPDSVRAQIETAEDALCAHVLDAGIGAGGSP